MTRGAGSTRDARGGGGGERAARTSSLLESGGPDPLLHASHLRFREKVRAWLRDEGEAWALEAEHDDGYLEAIRAMGRAGILACVAPRAAARGRTAAASRTAAAGHTAAAGRAAGAGRTAASPAARISSRAICLAREELSRVSPLLDLGLAMQGLGSFPVALGGSAALRRRILPAVAAGRAVAAFAITEDGAGSDPSSIQTRARRRAGGGWVLEGEKRFISNAGLADFYVVFARVPVPPPRSRAATGGGKRRGGAAPALGAFVVPAGAPGLAVEREALLDPHPIGRVRLHGVRVPEGAQLGKPARGLSLALATLAVFRPTVGAAACGLAARALEEARRHLDERRQFGRPLGTFQGLRFRFAELATELEAARLLVYRAARARDREPRAVFPLGSMAKLHATEAAQRVVDGCLQMFGARGLVRGTPLERLYRAVRALRIYEGTTEVQLLLVARALLPRGGA